MGDGAVNTQNSESICVGHVYKLPDFMRITGMGRHAMRAARAKGLRVIYEGPGAFVLGDDFIEYLKTKAEAGPSNGVLRKLKLARDKT